MSWLSDIWDKVQEEVSNVAEDFRKNPFEVINAPFYATRRTFEAGVRGVGELSGAGNLRDILNEQREATRAYQARQDQLFKDEQQRMFNQDLLASQAAGAAQIRSVGGSSIGSTGSRSSGSDSGFNAVDLYIGGR